MPAPVKQAVPRPVQATSDGGRAVTRTPRASQKRLSAPAIPAAISQACRRSSSPRVGAGIAATDASTRLLRSGDTMEWLLVEVGERVARPRPRARIAEQRGPQSRG